MNLPDKRPFTLSTGHLLLCIFLLGLAIRLYKLDFQSFWMDEYLNISIAKSSLHYFRDSLQSLIPPLYIYVLGGWLKFAPINEITARLPGALIGSLTVPVFYVLGKEMFGKKTALWAAFFLAISTIHTDYSQEAKYYPLMLFFVLAVNLEYWRAVTTEKHVHFFLYGFYFTLMMYAHYYCAAFFVIHWAHIRLNYRKNKRVIKEMALTHLFVILALSPVIAHIVQNYGGVVNSASWIPSPNWRLPLHSIICVLAGQQWTQHLPIYIEKRAIILLFGGFILFSMYSFWLKGKEINKSQSALSLVILWIIIPIVFIYAFSAVFFSIYLTRYLLPVMFGVYLFLAWTVAGEFPAKKRSVRHWAAFLIICGYIFMNFWGLRYYFLFPVRAQYRQAAQYIAQNGRSTQKIALIGYREEGTLTNYYLKRYGVSSQASVVLENQDVPADTEWLIDGYSNFNADPAVFLKKEFTGLDLYQRIKPAPP